MGLKLIYISKRGNWWSNPLDITLVVLTINCLCKTFPDFAIKMLCFLTTINLTFKFQLMVHEKLSWRNCKCPVDLWQTGQIVLKKFHPSKNPGYCRHGPGGRAGGCQTCGTHISVTAWWIFSIWSFVELSRPVVVHSYGHLPICPIWACPWAKNLSNLAQIGSRLCGTHISETAGWIDPI